MDKDKSNEIQELKQTIDHLQKSVDALTKNLPALRPQIIQAVGLPTPQELKDHLCPGISDADAFIFLQTAKAHGLNPFKKEIHLMPFNDPETGNRRYSAVVDYHVFLGRAKQNPTYLYFEAGLRRSDNGKVDGAWCKIYDEKFGSDKDGNRNFFYHEIDANEYDKEKATWKTKRNTMLKKTAIRQAHNLCYPELAQLPETNFEIIDASGIVAEESNEKPKNMAPPIDRGFFGPEDESTNVTDEPTEEEQPKELTEKQKRVRLRDILLEMSDGNTHTAADKLEKLSEYVWQGKKVKGKREVDKLSVNRLDHTLRKAETEYKEFMEAKPEQKELSV